MVITSFPIYELYENSKGLPDPHWAEALALKIVLDRLQAWLLERINNIYHPQKELRDVDC